MVNAFKNKLSSMTINNFLKLIYVLFLITPFAFNIECNKKSELDSLLAFEANQISNNVHIFITFDELKFEEINNFEDFKQLELAGDKFLDNNNIKIHVNCFKNESKNLRNDNSVDLDALSLEYKKEKEIHIDIVTRNLIKKNTIKDNSLRGLLNYLNTINDQIKNSQEFQSKIIIEIIFIY